MWEIRAKKAKEEHSAMYPGYRFRPVHNKDKAKKKTKSPIMPEDEQRCEAVAQLLLEGKKGDELAAAIRRLDDRSDHQMVLPYATYPSRRPSSVPLPDGPFHPIALPALPFLQMGSRAGSPVGNISRSARFVLGHRRPSSVQPVPSRPWGTLDPMVPLHHDLSPLPEVDNTLFDPAFLDAGFSLQSFNIDDMYSVPPHASSPGEFPPNARAEVSPKDATVYPVMGSDTSPLPQYASMANSTPVPVTMSMSNLFPMHMSMAGVDIDPLAWLGSSMTDIVDVTDFAHSQPSSIYSGSPANSDVALPTVVAPKPQQVYQQQADVHLFEGWGDVAGHGPSELVAQDQMETQQSQHMQDGFSGLLLQNEFEGVTFEGGAFEYAPTQA